MNTDLLHYIFLVSIGFIAGIINTLAGGGSLLTLPLLIFMGLPPALANGTNRVGVFFQTLVGVAGFKSKGVVVVPHGLYFGLSAMVGALLGAWWAVDIKGETFNYILGFVMLIVLYFTLLKPKTHTYTIERLNGIHLQWSLLAFFLIGLFGGFIQVGAGIFILMVLNQINHISLIKSNAYKSMIVAIYTLAALVVFIVHDEVNWFYGLILALGQGVGAWISSRWSTKKDDVVIRYFLILVVVGMTIKLWFFN